MRLTRVFVDSPLTPDADVNLPAAAANHVGRVLRLRAGAEIVAFDGGGSDYRCELLSVEGNAVRVRVGPYASRSEAEAAAATVKALGLEAVVFRQAR